jgi:hypothetical protein
MEAERQAVVSPSNAHTADGFSSTRGPIHIYIYMYVAVPVFESGVWTE